ncbi:hypothetical protein B7494_g316 [Chlorociboria aeruginascens]|nr:hypothetical protein B7494_g316 [Chlorociboria aeruginascens]
MATFKYEPINSDAREIRLLHIVRPPEISTRMMTLCQSTDTSSKVHGEDIVYCTLETLTLSKNLKYDALSYTWGTDANAPGSSISISGQTFKVTVNLSAALRQLRDSHYLIPLWVDAVCINQQDSKEKGKQIPMMKRIYEGARHTVVWLGPAADNSDAIMDAWDHIGEKAFKANVLDITPDIRAVLFDANPDEQRNAIERSIKELSNEVGWNFPYAARKALTERDYWRRVWIVQEIVLARNVIILCGRKSIIYEHLAAGSLFVDIHCGLLRETWAHMTPDDYWDPVKKEPTPMAEKMMALFSSAPNPSLSYLIGARTRQHNRGRPFTLFDLLKGGCIIGSTEGQRKATDPRDMIYGFIALAADVRRPEESHEMQYPYTRRKFNIQVDYSKSSDICHTTTAQVYTSAARYILEQGHTEILAWCQPTKQLSYLPSWVPDFSALIREPIGDCQPPFHASCTNTTNLQFLPIDSAYPTHLMITGIRVSKIAQLGAPWMPDLKSTWSHTATDSLFTTVDSFISQSQTREVPMPADALWRIPCADQLLDPRGDRVRNIHDVQATKEGYEDVKRRIERAKTGAFLQSEAGGRYLRTMSYLHNRRPAILEKGYVGLVPMGAAPGDVAIIVMGIGDLQNKMRNLKLT